MKKLVPIAVIFSLGLSASTEQKVDKLLKDLNVVLSGSQLICEENYTKSPSLLERACEDLHEAACLDENGKGRYEGRMDQITKDIEEKLKAKRDEVAKELYGEDFNTAARKMFKEAGLEFNSDVDDYDLYLFLSAPDRFYDIPSLLSASKTCQEKFVDEEFDSKTPDQKIAAIKKMNEEAKKLAAKNKNQTPYYLEEILNLKSSTCRFEKDEPDCKNMAAIKREALLLSREKNDPRYIQKFNAFYDKYFKFQEVTVENNEESIKSAYEKVVALGAKQCEQTDTVMGAEARAKANEFLSKIQFSKPFVEFTLNEFYSKKRHEQVSKLFNFAKEAMIENLRGHVSDPERMKKIEESYSNLKLHWLTPPGADQYEKDGKVSVLKVSDELTLADNTIYHAFADPGLRYFTEFNANYMTSQAFGDVKTDSRVDMQPAMLTLLDANPLAFLEVLGHEVAHKVGPSVSRWNGFDLNQDHKDLLACYADQKSIGLMPNQGDEVMSDYFSSQIIARYLETLPKEKRLDAVIQSVESYCLFEDTHMPTMSDAHPDAYMRISGILGANPKIRSLIGCEKESSKFKSCGPK